MHNSRQVVYVAFMNDHVHLCIYLSTQPKRAISTTNPMAPMKTMKSQKLVDLANQNKFYICTFFSTYIHRAYNCNMMFIQLY